jgi:DNA-directed RNA polymerase subunit RPC12/RpoP
MKMDINDIKLNLKIAKSTLAMIEKSDGIDPELIGYQKGYIRAYQEMLDDIEIHTETATWMETTCLRCEKKFKLEYVNITMGHEEISHDNVPVITCPHCKKRNEF